MLIKIHVLAEGPGPSERLIGVKTRDGVEQIVVSNRIIKDNSIDVGLALSNEADNFLVELPRESTRGRWRVWVPNSEVCRLQAAE